MSVTLRPVLQALGYSSEVQQRDFIKLLAAAGAFGELPGVNGTLNDEQSQRILEEVKFETAEEAAHWLHEDATQKYWLECSETDSFRQNRGEMLNALHHLGALKEVRPQMKHCRDLVVFGAKEGTTSTRLDWIGELYEEGLRFENVYLLSNDRPLDPGHEPSANVATELGSIATEEQMLKAHAYEKMEMLPEALQKDMDEGKVKVVSIMTPNQEHGHANTQDTVKSYVNYLKDHNIPLSGDAVFISSAPHIAYQDAAVKSVLMPLAAPKPSGEGGPEMQSETVGARIAEDDAKISIALDAITRRIDVGFDKLLETLKAEKPEMTMVDPAELKVDAATYQFRSGGDKNGVTQKRRGDGAWDPVLDSTPLVVHNGTVVDGHHRRDKAIALNAQGIGPGKVAAIVLGRNYLAKTAKIVGAYRNMAQDLAHEGSDPADIADGARAFKEADTLPFDQKNLLPHLRLDGDINIAHTLRGLSEESLGRVTRKELPAKIAAEVVQRVNDQQRQDSVIRIISAKLHQNYDNYAAQTVQAENDYAMHTLARTGSLDMPPLAPGFVGKLQQQRADNAAGLGMSA